MKFMISTVLKTSACIIFLALFSACQKVPEEMPMQPPYNPGTYRDSIINIYNSIVIVDAHNHDACNQCNPVYIPNRFEKGNSLRKKYGVDKVVLFGDYSRSKAVYTDSVTFEIYKKNPDFVIPFIAGINIHDSLCLGYIKEYFDVGIAGIGEIVGASTYSPNASSAEWKPKHPLDGYLPEIYEMCALYKRPVLLHIDPPFGEGVEKFIEAARRYPETNFIYAHANAYAPPGFLRSLIEANPNIYIDFFVGFNTANPGRKYELKDFVPIIEEYPDRFVICTDSGAELEKEEDAYWAFYSLFELLDYDVVEKIASKNILSLTNRNPEGQ